jgi:hypothetical protein
MFAELADEPKFVAIKESSGDVRRITDIHNAVGDRYQIFTGVDDLALESLMLGAVGWVAGLVCAFPRETVAIYDLMRAGRIEDAREIYRWFMPLCTRRVAALRAEHQGREHGSRDVDDGARAAADSRRGTGAGAGDRRVSAGKQPDWRDTGAAHALPTTHEPFTNGSRSSRKMVL